MDTFRNQILLICKSERQCRPILEVINEPWNKIVTVHHLEMAIKESLKNQFDLVICHDDLSESNAFQIYTVLNNEVLGNEVPFIIVLDSFDKNKVLIGLELGVDNFIFPSFEAERIEKIIQLQLKKSLERSESERKKYDTICNVIPYGTFLAEDTTIIEGNPVFFKMINQVHKKKCNYSFRQLFTFDETNNPELKLSRLTNGLSKNSIFRNVSIHGRKEEKFDICFTTLKSVGSSYRVIGIVMPAMPDYVNNTVPPEKTNGHKTIKEEHNNHANIEVLTSRERQILDLSSKGYPVKQIAESLQISSRTVEKHRSNIIKKSNAENIVEAVFLYSKNMLSFKAE